uniref:Uncharacterized protein n=1 Tax=Avena sativa TaxID=4498 RepID=A0ACD5XDS3_AVESA
MGASKKARASTKPADTKGAPEKETQDTEGGHTEEVGTFNVFTHDMDTLECDICTLPFDSQIYTCKNGHAACGNCCVSMSNRCPSCNEPIGDIRCRAMEKVLAGMTRPCKYRKYGCTKVVKFMEMRKHEEETCPYGPYSCPFNGCTYSGVQLYNHILDDHEQDGQATNVEASYYMGTLFGTRVTLQKDAPFHALLHHDGKTVFMLLNGGDVLKGRSLSIVRMCPRPGPDEEAAEKVEYEMVVKGDQPGSLSLTTPGMQYVRRLEGYQPERFLFVPDAFWGSSGSVTVTVYV